MIKRSIYLAAGLVAVAAGLVGLLLPLVPTVPFLILAAFCFARSNPAWEARLLSHPHVGPAIRSWRERGAIPLVAKQAATAMLAVSCTMAALVLTGGWALVPALVAAAVLAWMWSRPSV